MGGQASSLQWGGNTIKEPDKHDLISGLTQACQKDNVEQYRELWLSAWPFREQKIKAKDDEYDQELLDHGLMRYIRHGLQHPTSQEWREAGVVVARTFLKNQHARQHFKLCDLPMCLSMMTMGTEGEDAVGGPLGAVAADAKQKQVERNMLAVEIMSELCEYPEFMHLICKSSILNFLCTVVNQVPEAIDQVSRVFVQLADHPANLSQLREASVDDIFETILQSTPFEHPGLGGDLVRWKSNINALANVSNVLGTMLKWGFECQVSVKHIVRILSSIGASSGEDSPDRLRLLSQLVRLFYWVCRTTGPSSILSPHEEEGKRGDEKDHGLFIDHMLKVLSQHWTKCLEIQEMVKEAQKGSIKWSSAQRFEQFCTEDLDRSIKITADSEAYKVKETDARTLLCYLNCLLWVCLAQPAVRWRLRHAGFRNLERVFELKQPEFLTVVLSTARHLVDIPGAQQCIHLMRLFGIELVKLLVEATRGPAGDFPLGQVLLLLDALAMLSLQRGMQELFTEMRIYEQLQEFRKNFVENCKDRQDHIKELNVIDKQSLLICAQVSAHPSNRLSWVCSDILLKAKAEAEADPRGNALAKQWGAETQYPPRHEFEPTLELWQKAQESSETLRTVSSLLLTLFQEKKFHQPADDLTDMLRSVFDWWNVNSTAQYEDLKEAHEQGRDPEHRHVRSLREHVEIAKQRRETGTVLTSGVAMNHCAPQECVLALSMFSRLALEPKFKLFFLKDGVVEALLGCVCSGICAEAREAAAVIANLMWMPGAPEEKLVCWLKFDGPKCTAVDASNVLLPVRVGNPKPVEMGRGMYKSTWGINFVQGSCITLHPDGLQTHKVPGTLTSASPSDTFSATASTKPYQWLGKEPDRRSFTITCWFYWPSEPTKREKVLIQTTPGGEPPVHSVAIVCEVVDNGSHEGEFVWVIRDDSGTSHKVRTPKLLPGWHHFALVSSATTGSKFWLDTWCHQLRHMWIKNDFYNIGNCTGDPAQGGGGGSMPFGLIADFRIYADAFVDKRIQELATPNKKGREADPEHLLEGLPDKIARDLAAKDAATILAQRLDCPDTAAECLRALGSLATLASQRAKIYNVCGRELLKMQDSPYPMLRRQAARLLNNLA